MKGKIGRPKYSKAMFKGVLIGARFSPNESMEVHKAIELSRREKSQWIRSVLLSAANPKKYRIMKINLTVEELEELSKQSPSSASDGGFQNFLVKLQHRVNGGTRELELDHEDLSRIHRYAFGYKGGGWQTRLKKIFESSLGRNLNGQQ